MKPIVAILAIWLPCDLALADDAPRPTSVREPALREQLLRRTKADQEARAAMVAWMKAQAPGSATPAGPDQKKQAEFAKLGARVKAADEDNTAWLKGVVRRSGWPTISAVGKDGANAAWLLVQHADADPKFQRLCLDRMSKLPPDEVARSDVAYLTDRVLLAEGKEQRYGTQCTAADGRWTLRPTEDEANLDRRRAEVGLPPIAEYLKLLEREYGRPGK